MAKPYLVPAIKRSFEMLELLAKAETGLTISQLHRDLKLPLSSAATMLYTLEHLGYVERCGDDSRYRLSMKLMSFSPTLERDDLISRCHTLLTHLVNEAGLTGHLAVARENESVYIDRVQAPGLVQVTSYIGMTWPLYSSGVGKAMLAFMDPQSFQDKLAQITIRKLTERTVSSKKMLGKQLAEFRHQGYSFEIDEDVIGVACVAAPVFGFSRRLLGAISVAGTTQQVNPETIPELGKLVRRYAGLMSTKLGADL
jgi:IclR family transcriptional regulator, KDG regulon repressor